MKKFLLVICLLVSFLTYQLFFQTNKVYSDELDDLTKKINELQSALDMSRKATAPFESQLRSMQQQLAQIEARVKFLENDIASKRKIINDGYNDLEKQKEMLNKIVRDYYIKTYSFSPLVVFVSSRDASQITRTLAYQRREANRDKEIITNIALKITDLEAKKIKLEDEETRLSAVKARIDSEKVEIEKLVKGAKDYQASLTNQIAQLSVKQQELLAQKLGSLNIPKSAYTMRGGCVDDRNIDPGFSPRFALFTYGVPNRIGLNQFGAKGRAEAGQNAETILKSYYSADYTTGYDTGINIHVVGSNEYGQSFDDNWSIEEYLKHIYEMPTDWPIEALKAQVIAARSYALSYTNNGSGTICPSQQCQVVKREENSDAWKRAVEETRGIVMTQGGLPIKAWFSSTHGGYVFTSGDIGWSQTSWTKRLTDTTASINSFSDLENNAYDKNSPWFYCDWGSRAQYNKTAWLKSEEIADIINVLLLAKADSSTQTHLSQIDKPNPDGTDTWDMERVKQELRSRQITPFNNISDISVDWDKATGRTTGLNVSGDSGSRNFGGDEFKTYFNLRAPSNINIVGPLYNAEKR